MFSFFWLFGFKFVLKQFWTAKSNIKRPCLQNFLHLKHGFLYQYGQKSNRLLEKKIWPSGQFILSTFIFAQDDMKSVQVMTDFHSMHYSPVLL